jgi:LiaI-LiaF-like transmembrane region
MDNTDPTQTGVPAAMPPPAAPPPAPPLGAPQPQPQPPAPPNGRVRRRDGGGRASLFFGVLLLLVGLWYFATRTLGLDLPRLDWGRLWPLLLIALGLWIAIRSFERRR